MTGAVAQAGPAPVLLRLPLCPDGAADVPREGQPRVTPTRVRPPATSSTHQRCRIGAGTHQPSSASIRLATGVLDRAVFVPVSACLVGPSACELGAGAPGRSCGAEDGVDSRFRSTY